MNNTISTQKDTLQQQLKDVNNFMIREMNCGSSLNKLDKWEKDFAAWKTLHGFHHADDAECIANTIRMRM